MMLFIPMMIVVAMSDQAARHTPPTDPVVQVGVYSYKSDGTIGARAFGTSPLDSVVWTSESLCQVGAGQLLAGTPPGHAWKFSRTIVSQTPDEAVIQLEWQRTHENGQPISGRGGSVQLTLRRGEPVPLDFASPTASTCGVTSVGFEARYEPQFGPPFARTGVVGGGIGAGAGSGSGSGGQGARVTGTVTSNTLTMSDDRKSGAQAGPTDRSLMFEVNLWLVHTVPGREEEVRQQTLRSTPEGARFSFAPVTIGVPDGQVSVRVNGSYSITENGQLAFTTNRVVAFTPTAASPHRTTVASSKGEGKTVIDMPGPDDVLEFGLPPFGIGVGPGGPDKFAIRVRIRPAQ
jgi:hypothetical protein